METSTQFIWGMVFGIIGMGYFAYGKKQRAPVPLITGVALFIFPYFIPNIYMLVLVGVVLSALPYFWRL